MSTAKSRRLLILFPGALGDFLCALPTFLALGADAEETQIVGNPAPLELIERGPFRTASIHRREIADLFAAEPLTCATRTLLSGFDVTHSWTGYDNPRVAERLQLVTTGTVHMHQFRGMAPGEHAVDYYARCVGLSPRVAEIWTTATDEDWAARQMAPGRGLLVVHPGSGAPRKNWEGFSDLVPRLAAEWSTVLLLGPAETERQQQFDQQFGSEVRTVRDVNLRQVAALLRRAALYIGNDSGVSHLASAVGTRSIVLFGATDALRWAPRGATVIEAPEPCLQCGPERLCTHRIGVEQVFDVVKRLTIAGV